MAFQMEFNAAFLYSSLANSIYFFFIAGPVFRHDGHKRAVKRSGTRNQAILFILNRVGFFRSRCSLQNPTYISIKKIIIKGYNPPLAGLSAYGGT
ncbi:MAG: hypothetical protein GF307_14735 [candidate division Zixibacteria bacterium]|nr:hypothetical protein [candidate division Zixibacteria bacterium]